MTKFSSNLDFNKRNWLKESAALTGITVASGFGGLHDIGAQENNAHLTSECGADKQATISQTAGPFYTPNSPLRSNFRRPGIKGAKLRLSGKVLNQYCEPINGAVLDFWHADNQGVYDNKSFHLRGYLFINEAVEYALTTIFTLPCKGETREV